MVPQRNVLPLTGIGKELMFCIDSVNRAAGVQDGMVAVHRAERTCREEEPT